jgi:threonine dehydratase
VAQAQRFAFSRLRLVLEPGGAVALAAVLAGKARADENTVVIASGGNVDPAAYARVIADT